MIHTTKFIHFFCYKQSHKYSHKNSSFQTNVTVESPSPILIQYCPAKKSSDYCCSKKNTNNLNNNLVRTKNNGRIQYVSTVPFNAGARRVVKMLGNKFLYYKLSFYRIENIYQSVVGTQGGLCNSNINLC